MRLIPGVAVGLLAATIPAVASGQVALMPKIGTPGLGMDLAVAIGGSIVVRGGGAIVPYEPEFTITDIDWKVEMPANALAAVDLHLAGSGFRISGGAFFLTDDVLFEGVLTESVQVGEREYTPSQLGRLEGAVAYEDISPFVSLGYGRAAASGAGLFIELGAAFIGKPGVELSHSGGELSAQEEALLILDLRRQSVRLENELEDASVYPILNIGVRIGL